MLKMGEIQRYRFLLPVKLKPRSLEESMAWVPGMGTTCHGLYSWTIYCDSLQWLIGAKPSAGVKKEELPPFPAPFPSVCSPELCWIVSEFLIRKWHEKDITGTISRHCKEFPSAYMAETSVLSAATIKSQNTRVCGTVRTHMGLCLQFRDRQTEAQVWLTWLPASDPPAKPGMQCSCLCSPRW